MKNRLMAGSAPASFAHLMGAPAGRTRAESDDDKDKEMKARKARRAAEDKRRADEDKKRKDEDAKRAEEDGTLEPGDAPNDDPTDSDPDCPECDGTGEVDGETCPMCGGDGEVHSPDQPQDIDDSDVDDMDDEARKANRQGKKAERARWTKVLGSREATGRVGPACAMLANGDMNPGAIVATLKSMPAEGSQARGGLRERMAAERPRNPGPNAASGQADQGKPSFAAQVIAAGKQARGESV